MSRGNVSSRVRAIMERMTLAEKLGQLSMLADGLVETGPPGPHNPFTMIAEGRVGSLLNVWGRDLIREAQRKAVEESRLGVPLFFGLDVVHGHRSIHPVPLGEACAFDRELWERTARDSAIEAVADGIHMTFAPMIDVSRDIRWGRIVECAGEDPYVNAEFARARVRGYQARDDARGFMRLAACAKHFCAYGAVLAGRDYAEAEVSERTLHEVHLPPFAAAVAEGVEAIMPAFIDVGGVAMTANRKLLRNLLREQWGFDGLVVSDYNAVAELINHGVAGDLAEAAALALDAGVDIDMMSDAYVQGLPIALERGQATLAQIDEAVARVLGFKERMGLFDDPYRGLGEDISQGLAARRALARDAACKSIVLLKNEGEILPLRAAALAVVGPLADAPEDQLGAWASAGSGEDSITIIQGLRSGLGAHVSYARGAGLNAAEEGGVEDALMHVRDADVTVLCIGESRYATGEASSRTKPEIPAAQLELAREVYAAGKPVVLVLCLSRPLILPDWLVNGARALLVGWHGGSQMGAALADILSGAFNPSAKLCISWPVTTGQTPVFFGMRPTGRPHDPGNSWSTGFLDSPFAPLFSFGEGLGYSKFSRGPARLDVNCIDRKGAANLLVDVTNVSDVFGVETLYLFARDPVAQVTRPMLELKDFTKTPLAPGETKQVTFSLRASDFSYLDVDMQPRLDDGVIRLFVGSSARAQDLDCVELTIARASAQS